jgi:diaminopimelate epimerase
VAIKLIILKILGLIQFYKYHGAGNDFILIDARKKSFKPLSEEDIHQLCDRHFGIGADGLMLLLSSKEHDFRMKYYNSDGREGTMCGNGGRCITAFAHKLGIVKKEYRFEAIDGIHNSYYTSDDKISLKMNDVSEITKYPDGIFVDTGSPHFVLVNDSPHDADMIEYGKKYRHHKRFGKGGTNVNAVSFKKNKITIATFERGVENETLACGTGAVAAAVAIAEITGKTEPEYLIKAKGGNLSVKLKKDKNGIYSEIHLTGPAEFVFEGIMKILH